jgi:hypothetical protein
LDDYKKPINHKKTQRHIKKIKQTHVISGKTVVFNSVIEININLGISRTKIINAIKNKTITGGFLWEYLDDTETENNFDIQNNSNTNDIKFNKNKSKGRKIQKIDPDNLTKIIKVYDNLLELLRDPVNKGMNKTSIKGAAKSNKTYGEFRWNFVEKGSDPTVCNILPTVKKAQQSSMMETILKLNDTKTEIIDSYATKREAAISINVCRETMRKIIVNQTKYNNFYYIEQSKCPLKLLKNYKKPINKFTHAKAKKIRQFNPISKESIIYNSLKEIHIKLDITDEAIISAVNNKTLCNGCLWEYYDCNK